MDPLETGTDDELLRTQFAMGLRTGSLKQELQRQLRRTSTLTFVEACEEAKALERKLGHTEEASVCPTVATTSYPRPIAMELQQVKDALRAELRQELKEQVTLLGKSIVEELQERLKPLPETETPPQPSWHSQSNAPQRQRRDQPLLGNLTINGMLKAKLSAVTVGTLDTFRDSAHGDVQPRRVFGTPGHSRAGEPGGAPDRAPTKALHEKAWDTAFAACQRAEALVTRVELQGVARLQRQPPVVLPPSTETIVWAHVPQSAGLPDCPVMIEDMEGHGSASTTPLATVTQIDQKDVRGRTRLVLTNAGPQVIEVDVQQVGRTLSDDHPALALHGEGLDDDQQAQLKALLKKWSHVFAAHEEDFGRTAVVTHQIPTGTAPPIRERYRPVPPNLYPELRTLLQGMLDSGVVKESSSPWAAPVVLAKKKDGSWRFCVDYRKLNAITHKDSFPLPRIEESLTSLTKCEWYSTLDLASGYWQVEVAPEDQEKTAFTTPFGLYHFERMPFGLCNAPATFQRLMQRCLEHRKVTYLGHIVSSQGVATDPDKVAVVRDWATPMTVKQVRSFLGFAGYYRRFIPAFSKVAAPLHQLLQGQANRSSAPIQWTPSCQVAFDNLKQALLSAPILAYADFQLPFRLYTDASLDGLGAVLAQVQGGSERVVAYASRSLHPTERNDQNYSSFKLELLALKWAITEKFKDYLWGAEVTVFTDNNLWSISKRRNWVQLSKGGWPNLQTTPTIYATDQGQPIEMPMSCHDYQERQRSTLCTAWHALHRWNPVPCKKQWGERQRDDTDLQLLHAWKASSEPPVVHNLATLSPQLRCLLREWRHLELCGGTLVRCVNEPDTGAPVKQIIIPQAQARPLWEEYHRAAAHASGDKWSHC
ncbi:hypothetical protein F2P79_011956 [Pimephales promelas]|nr:hypothetical protein F2P79_011956 [Pimephales promelas]